MKSGEQNVYHKQWSMMNYEAIARIKTEQNEIGNLERGHQNTLLHRNAWNYLSIEFNWNQFETQNESKLCSYKTMTLNFQMMTFPEFNLFLTN